LISFIRFGPYGRNFNVHVVESACQHRRPEKVLFDDCSKFALNLSRLCDTPPTRKRIHRRACLGGSAETFAASTDIRKSLQ
jgi:hypothetical protein